MRNESDRAVNSPPPAAAPHWWWAAGLFLLVTILFVSLRYDAGLFNSDAYFVFFRDHAISWTDAFAPAHNRDAFRPLSVMIEFNVSELYRLGDQQPHFWVVFAAGALVALIAVLVFALTRLYGGGTWSVAAAFLFAFSLGSIGGFWHNVFSIYQAPLVLAMTGGIYFYALFRRTPDARIGRLALAGFVACCVIGPWFREAAFAPALVAAAYEGLLLLRGRSRIFLLALVMLAHGLAPKILPWLLGWYDGAPGWIGSESTNARLIGSLADLNWARAGYIINEFPPSLWLLIVAGLAIALYRRLPPALGGQRTAAVSLVIALLGLSFWPLHGTLVAPAVDALLPTVFLAAFAGLAGFLFGWELALFLPAAYAGLLVLPSVHEAHAAFVMPVLAVFGALALKVLFDELAGGGWRLPARAAAIVLGCLAAADHLANAVTSRLAIESINAGHQAAADWLVANAPAGSYLFVDAYGAHDIVYRASQGGGYFPAWRKRDGPAALRYSWNRGLPRFQDLPQKVLELSAAARAQGKRIFFVHQATASTDFALPLPLNALELRRTFEIVNLGLDVDPTRRWIRRDYRRQFAPSEWDSSYGWVGEGKSCCAWRSAIEIYELPPKALDGLDVAAMVQPARTPPVEAGLQARRIEDSERAGRAAAMTVRSASVSRGHPAERAIDGSTAPDDFWEAEGPFPHTLALSYPLDQRIAGYQLAAGELAKRMPRAWRFEGSRDGSTWTALDARAGEKPWTPGEARSYALKTAASYPYYRFTFTAGFETNILRIYEIGLK